MQQPIFSVSLVSSNLVNRKLLTGPFLVTYSGSGHSLLFEKKLSPNFDIKFLKILSYLKSSDAVATSEIKYGLYIQTWCASYSYAVHSLWHYNYFNIFAKVVGKLKTMKLSVLTFKFVSKKQKYKKQARNYHASS